GLRIWNERRDLAVLGVSHADTALPARMAHGVRLRVGHIQHVIFDVEAAGPAELLPFRDKLALLIKNLDAIVIAVGDEQPSLGIEGQTVRNIELARTSAL